MEITGFLQEHWVSLFMAAYLIGMMLYGHHRGFLRLSMSMLALILSVLAIRSAMPAVTSFIKENSKIRQWMGEVMLEKIGLEDMADSLVLPAQQRAAIESTGLPETIKKALIENNNEEIYRALGVDAFLDYISSYLADRFIDTFAFLLLFLTLYIGIRLVFRGLGLIAKLPILHGLDQIAGAALGLILAFVYFWIFCLVLGLAIGTDWGRYLLESIESVPWVSFLYHHNLLAGSVAGTLLDLL